MTAQHQILRAMQLIEHRRFADAERCLREVLSQEPEQDFALHQLAFCLYCQDRRGRESLETIDRAIGISPNDADHWALKAAILLEISSPAACRKAAEHALSEDPECVEAWTVIANSHLVEGQWAKAEAAARSALAVEPTHVLAANLLGVALRHRGELTQLRDVVDGLLAEDPENPLSHANAGWRALDGGDPRAAERHFLEALRLQPAMEFARQGLVESFRQRSPIFRMLFRWQRSFQSMCFPKALLVSAAVIAVGGIIGLALQALLGFGGNWALGVAVLAVVLGGMGIQFGQAVGNMMLWMDRSARHSLSEQERLEAGFTAGLLVFIGLAAAFQAIWGFR
jgi:tetratricopeptide (TPR) repeat protein